jgi:hypothetical protein
VAKHSARDAMSFAQFPHYGIAGARGSTWDHMIVPSRVHGTAALRRLLEGGAERHGYERRNGQARGRSSASGFGGLAPATEPLLVALA